MATIIENESAWSTTAASNDVVDTGIVWSEGQDAATVNNSARGMMAARAKARLDQGGALVAGGTPNALTVTTYQVLSAAHLANGQRLLVRATAGNSSGTVTFAPDGLTPGPIKRCDGQALAVGDIRPGQSLDLVYNAGASEWRCVSIPPQGSGKGSFSSNKNGTNQTIASATITKVTFTTELWDAGGYYDAPNSKWTPPPGTALITAQCSLVNLTGPAFFNSYLYKNGVLYQTGSRAVAGNAGAYVSGATWIALCSGTDYFEVYVQHNDGFNEGINGAAAQSYWAATLI